MDADVSDTLEITANEEGSDTELLTAPEIIKIIEESWINEKFAPEILPNKIEYIDCLLGQITYLEDNLRNLPSTDFNKAIHQLEIDRLRFLVTSYLRIRLEKIEAYVIAILKQEEQRLERGEESYLTESELIFAKSYRDSLEVHFNDALSFWGGAPPDEWKNQPVLPNMHSFVFLKSKRDIEGVVVDDDEGVVDLTEGAQMITSYKCVATLVKNGSVRLI